LESSFKKQTAPGEATVQNTAEYAEVHNEGLSAKIFGKTEFKMPRRQFVGHSAELDEKVNNMISAELNKIL
jgi:phage gpG-like protein